MKGANRANRADVGEGHEGDKRGEGHEGGKIHEGEFIFGLLLTHILHF